MFRGGIGAVVFAPVAEVVSRVLVQVAQTVSAAKDVVIEQESFMILSNYLEKIRPLLLDLPDKNLDDIPPLRAALESLEAQMNKAQVLILECSSRSRIYLLIKCRSIVSQVQGITHEIGRCLSLVPMAGMNLSVENRERAIQLLEDMQKVQFKASVAEEEIVDLIKDGIQNHRLDSAFSNKLLLQIASVVGVSVDPSSLRQELVKFKKEKEEVALHKDQAEAYQLEQIIGILNRADAVNVDSDAYEGKKFAVGVQSLPALQPFFCPITQEIMEDPVEIASGQTYEREAIRRWFAAGNRACPVTKIELETTEVKPNLALQQSIEEWTDRNAIISIMGNKSKLLSGEQDHIQTALLDLLRISEEKPIYKYWISSENLIPVTVNLLKSSQRDIRRKALATLCSLAANNENKEKIADAGAIPLVVRLLSRDIAERRQAVTLLLELAKNSDILDEMGKTQGCILLLVTMLNSEDCNAVEEARQLLTNLSKNDDNVLQMAEANHFKPLIVLLCEGGDETKLRMASALARIELPDQSKATLGSDGVIGPLVNMFSSGKLDFEKAAIGALEKLSSISENSKHMIHAGIVAPLLRILFSVTSVTMSLKERAAATLANIAACDGENDLYCEETICHILTLLNLVGPSTQAHLLRTLNSMCINDKVRTMLRENGAIQMLIQFFEIEDTRVKMNALKLLFSLSCDGAGKEVAIHLTQSHIQDLVKVFSASQDNEDKAVALGIIGNLHRSSNDMLELLLQAEVLPKISKLLSSELTKNAPKKSLLENAVSALLLFTNSSNLDIQTQAANLDVIPSLVQLLLSGSVLAKARAAAALEQLSENSGKLSIPVVTNGSRGCWWCLNGPREDVCKVHGGKCSVKSSFCLVEAKAIGPLIEALSDGGDGGIAQEAALGALTSLLYDERWEKGVSVISDADGVRPIVRLLTVGNVGAKEKAVWILEKMFRLEKYRNEYGSGAQMALIDLTQKHKGNSSTRQLAAKILAHLNILHNQSSYF